MKGRKKGMKRAYMKTYSAAMINKGMKIPNREVMADYARRTRSLGQEPPIEWNYGDPRMEVLAKIEQMKALWQGDFRQGVDKLKIFANFVDIDNLKITLYFAGDNWFFVKITATSRLISYSYPTRQRAIQAFNLNQIKWVSTPHR